MCSLRHSITADNTERHEKLMLLFSPIKKTQTIGQSYQRGLKGCDGTQRSDRHRETLPAASPVQSGAVEPLLAKLLTLSPHACFYEKSSVSAASFH